MHVIEKLKLAIRSSHQRMHLERLLNAEKSELLTGEIKDRLLKSQKRLTEAMLKHWSDAQITEREKALTQRLQKDAARLCEIDVSLQKGRNDGSPENEEGLGSKEVVQGRLEGRPDWGKMRPKKR